MTIPEAIDVLNTRGEHGNLTGYAAWQTEALDMAVRSLEAWVKVKADIAETILHYKDWGQVELKAQYKEEALEEVLDCINRHLKEVTECK